METTTGPSHRVQPGALVAGRYRVIDELACGGMGVVYRASQEPLGRVVALKLIRGDAFDETARRRFVREAQLLGSLNDARIVTVYDFGETPDGALFLAMELLHGVTLRERLSAGPLRWSELAPIARDVAAALAAAHAAGVVHRDLKPDNVFLARAADGVHAKVLDFGLAKGLADLLGDSPTVTRAGGLVGTPGYIAPEALNGVSETARQDVYALGVMLWECVVGRHPFAAETPLKTIVRASQEVVPPIEEGTRRVQGAPPGLRPLLALLCAREPEERIADGAAALAGLRALDGGDAPTLLTPNPTVSFDGSLPVGAVYKSLDGALASPAGPRPSPRVDRPRRVVVGARGLAGLLALVAVAVFASLSRRPVHEGSADALLTAADAALRSGNAVEARVAVRRALEREDSARGRALWDAASSDGRLLTRVVAGRATGVVFIDEDHVAVSNRNKAIEIHDLATGVLARQRDGVDEITDVDGADGALVRCDLAGNVRWRLASGEERARQVPGLSCRQVGLRDDTVWIGGNAAVVHRWTGTTFDPVPVPGGTVTALLLPLDSTRVVVADLASVELIVPGAQGAGAVLTPETPSALAASAAGDVVYLGGSAGGVYRIDVVGAALGTPTRLRAHGARVEALALSPSGNLLASAGADEIVRVGPPGGDVELALVDGPRAPIALAFSPSGRRLAAIARDQIVVVDVDALRARGPVSGHQRPVEALAVAGDALWSGGGDGVVMRWDLDRARASPRFSWGATVEDMDVAKDGRTLAAALADGRLLLVDAHDGRTIAGWVHPGGATGVRFSPDGEQVVSVGRDGRVLRARLPLLLPELAYALPPADATLVSVAVRDDGLIAVGGTENTVVVVDRAGGSRVRAGHCGTNFSVVFRADGLLAVPCNDGAIDVIDPVTSAVVQRVAVPTRIYDLSRSGDELLAAGHNGAFQVGDPHVRRVGPTGSMNRARAVADGVVMGGEDGTVRFEPRSPRAGAFSLRLASIGAFDGGDELAGVRAVDRSATTACALHTAGVSLWDSAGRSLGQATVDLGFALAAGDGTCALLTPGAVRIVGPEGEPARVAMEGSAIARDGEDWVVATTTHLVWLDAAGSRTREMSLPSLENAKVSALAMGSSVIALGADDGAVYVVSRAEPAAAVRTLREGPVSPARRVVVASDGTLAAGFESGELVTWDDAGRIIDTTRLHGPVVWLGIDERGLRAATSVGDAVTRQESRGTERCALLRSVWAATGGPPAAHDACRL